MLDIFLSFLPVKMKIWQLCIDCPATPKKRKSWGGYFTTSPPQLPRKYLLPSFFLKCQCFPYLPNFLKLRLLVSHFLPFNNLYSACGKQFPQLNVHQPGNLQQRIAFIYTGYYGQKGEVCGPCWRLKFFFDICIIYAFSLPKIEEKELVKHLNIKR